MGKGLARDLDSHFVQADHKMRNPGHIGQEIEADGRVVTQKPVTPLVQFEVDSITLALRPPKILLLSCTLMLKILKNLAETVKSLFTDSQSLQSLQNSTPRDEDEWSVTSANMTARLVTLILHLLVTGAVAQVPRLCPASCYCETADKISCERAEFETVPTNWPTSIRVLIIKSCSLLRIQKHAFRRYAKLEELIIEGCEHLRSLEKYAFRGLNHLRLLRLASNGNLTEVAKNAFSLISNTHGLRIQLDNNAFRIIRPGIFRCTYHRSILNLNSLIARI
uniref:LRRNT domain-containing protein n=1 Tax=Ascaris lumbricoides TaxID=6252 RepID=A0A9J2Q537_ASCLU